jgi:hypothetical protein
MHVAQRAFGQQPPQREKVAIPAPVLKDGEEKVPPPRSSTSACPSADVAANGLSTTTGRPASSAARANGTCVTFGDATTTRSSSSARSHSRSTRPTTSTSGCSRRACSARSAFPVTTIATRIPGVVAMSGA